MDTKKAHTLKTILLSNPLIYVLALGAAIRLYNCWFTFYINSDGVLYINQAKMIYYGRWDLMPSSGLTSLSNYPFFIAGAYAILQDWLLAARSISFTFGSLVLVPLYFLFRRLFDRDTSLLGTLIYALIPVFVSRSADVLRDPVYWFFMVSGMLLFTMHQQPRQRLYLALSCICFLMATWARVEAFLLIMATAGFILIGVSERFSKLLFFLLPVLIMAVLFLGLPLLAGVNIDFINRVPEIVDRLATPLNQYKRLAIDIEAFRLTLPTESRVLYEFMDKAGNFTWLVALGELVNQFLEGFFYPFCLILIAGVPGSLKKIWREPLFKYFSLIALLGWGLLYGHLLLAWNFDSRFLVLVMLPLFIYAGCGIERIKRYVTEKFKIPERTVITALCFLILLAGLPKNLYHREADKLVFRQIGEYVAKREAGNKAYIPVTSSGTIRQFAFYANLNNEAVIFPFLAQLDPHYSTPNNYAEFEEYLKEFKIKYFLWEEKFWSRQPYKVKKELNPDHFLELQRWYHPDTGNLILFKVML